MRKAIFRVLRQNWLILVILAQLYLSIYLLGTVESYWFGVYCLLTDFIIVALSIGRFDSYIEKQRPYARSNALRLNGGTHTDQQWEALKRRCGYRCCKCQRLESVNNQLTRDHIIPISLGGTNNISNIQPLCRECNSVKGARIVDYR